jgi:hypothetical protein
MKWIWSYMYSITCSLTHGFIHAHLISLSSLTLSSSLSIVENWSIIECFLFVYLFYVFVYMFIYVYNQQGEDIRIGTLGNDNILYGIHVYCSEAVSIVMQGLFHDHVKHQLLWKCWDVFFNGVKCNYEATMTVIQLSSWILRLYAQHATHIDTQPCKLAVIIYLDITHYSLTLIQILYTLSLNHIQYHTHQPTQIYYIHNILSQCSNICDIGSQANRQGNKTNIARPIFWILNIRHLKGLILTVIITFMAITLQALMMVNLDLRIVSSYGKGWNKYSQL